MQRERFFAERWPEIVPQLRMALAKAGAAPEDRDDLVQETALRLLGMWERIDWQRPVEALAQRIALNAWRDQWRRRGDREQLGSLPELASASDTERAALASVQVREVAQAFTKLGEGVVRTLRAAVYDAEAFPVAGATPAARMARTRARRALLASLNVASAVGAVIAGIWRVGRRQARYGVAGGALAAFYLAIAGGVAQPHPVLSVKPDRPASDIRAQSASRPVASRRGPVEEGTSRTKPETPHSSPRRSSVPHYYKLGAGPASVRVFVNASVMGYGAEVAKPRPGALNPVCTYGASPELPLTSRCR